MSSVCIGTLFVGVVLLLRCSAALRMLHYSVVFRLFCQYSVVCSASVPVFLALQYAASDLDRPQEDIHQYRDQERP